MSVLYKIPDEELLAALTKWGGVIMPTYVARNVLSTGRPHLGTPQILRQLKRLEKAGRVKRVDSNYARQLCWAAT